MFEPPLRDRLAKRLATWRAHRRPDRLPMILIPLGSRVYISGHADVEGVLVEISSDRILGTVVDDGGQAHWADARRLYRLP